MLNQKSDKKLPPESQVTNQKNGDEKKVKTEKNNIIFRLLLSISKKNKISASDLAQLSFVGKINFLIRFFGRKIPRVLLGFIILSIFILLFLFAQYDTKKSFNYEPIRTLDYKDIEWNEKINNEGYNLYSDGVTSFEWKAIIQPPNKSFLFKVEDISKTTLHIKKLTGSIEIPSRIKVVNEKEVHSTVSGAKKIISDTGEVTLESPTHFASILGISFVSPFQGETISINGKKFNIATIQLPEKSKIIKVGDGPNPADTYKVDNFSYLFHNFLNPAVVYYQPIYHAAIQFFIILLGIFSFIFIFFGVKRFKIPSIELKTKYFFYFFGAVALLMLLLAIISPNPYSIILNFDKRDTQYETDHFIANEKNVPLYLWWVLSATRSIDSVVIGDASERVCGTGAWRHFYLSQFSVQKFIILEDFKENPCARFAQDIAPKKVSIIPQSEVEKELATLKSRSYPWSFMFIFNIKIVFILSNIIVFLTTMFLTWKAFSIKKIKDIIWFALYGFVAFFIVTLLFIITGFFAHMAVGYHGISNIGLIMSNYVLPGVFRGGNNLRTLFAFAGCFFALIFLKNVRSKVNFQLYPYFIVLIVALLIIPKTEYFVKRFFLTAISAEAYVWDYKIDVFNSLDFYQSWRDANPINYTKDSISKEVKAEREMIYAKSLKSELRFGEATRLYKNILFEYKDFQEIVAEAHYELGELYYQQKTINVLNKNISEIELVLPKNEYLKKAIDEFVMAIDINPNAEYTPEAIYRLVLCHLALKQSEQANLYAQIFLEKFPDHDKMVYVEFLLIDALIGIGRNEEALQKYQIMLEKYPEQKSPEALLKNAYIYQKLGNIDQSTQIYFDLISRNPDNFSLISEAYNQLQYLVSREEGSRIKNSLSAFEKEKGKNYLEALAIYNKLDESFQNETFNANNLFRKGESYHSLALLTYTSSEKLEYQKLSEDNYKKIVEKYPSNPIAEIAKQKLEQVEVLENKNVNLSYDLGKREEAFDEKDIVSARKEMDIAGSLRIQIPKLKTECGNDACEIGENPTSCATDCETDSNKIIIQAKGVGIKENWRPRIQLWVEKILIKEWEVNTSEYLDFSMPFELPDRAFQIDIVYLNDVPDNKEQRLHVKSVALNNQKIILEERFETFGSTVATTSQEQPQKTQTNIKNEGEKVGLSYPPNFRSLYKNVRESRGITLYFASIICLCIMFLLRKNLRTFVSPIIFFFIARGITRVAEQDVFRAWASLPHGIVTGIQIIMVLFIINIVFSIIFNPLKTVGKIKIVAGLIKKKLNVRQKS